MSAGQRESVTVSFTHISEDVIVPSDNIGESKFIRNSIITIGFVLLLVWLFASQPWQTISLWDILSAGFFLFIFLLSVLVLTKQEWYEVDRKLGRINRWSNKRKNKELPPMQPSGLTCKAIKQISGGKTGMSYYHIWAVDDKENAVDRKRASKA
jgi:hypothetical protein